MSGAELERDQASPLQRVLDVLSDETSREILSALGEPRTATELADRCGIPSSTVYRKLDTLTRAGLLKECVTVKPEYGRVSRYELNVDHVEIAIDDGRFSLAIERPTRSGDKERI
jgi:DNA-binding transcriptional ArsR family regulator